MDIQLNDYQLIRSTIVDMLYDRSLQPTKRFHFPIGSLDLYRMIPLEALAEIYNEAVSDKIYHLNFDLRSEYGQKVQVCFFKDGTKLEQNIKKSITTYHISKDDLLIVILCNKQKPLASYLETDKENVEIFWYKSLTFNPTRHILVPKHELLNPIEKDELKKIYMLNRMTNLPTIRLSDPIAKYYGMREGDVCRITRHNPNIGKSILYRLVTGI